MREKDFPNIVLTKNIEMHVLEIPKVKENDVLRDELAQWMKYIENPENEEVKEIMWGNKYWKQAEEELAYLSGDPDFQRLVEARAGFLMDQECYKKQCIERGQKEGMQKGRKEEKIEIAKKLLKMNISIEKVAEATGLSKEEIQELE